MSFEDKVFYGACGIGAVGWTLDAIHLVDRKSIGIVGEHIGNFNPVMETIMMAGLYGRSIQSYGERKKSKILSTLGKYLPDIVTPCITLYAVLGEGLWDIIPKNAQEVEDIPAAIVAGVVGYIITKYCLKNTNNAGESYNLTP
jgi:hypothetical protein